MNRRHWSPSARRFGIAGALTVLVIGILYIGVIASWLIVEGTPREPIGDPYLAVMEVLTLISALGLVGLVLAIAAFTDSERRVHGTAALTFGALAAGLTAAVHFVQLTAVRQMWREGLLPDYRLVWPSTIFAVEYFAWDVLVGLMMVFASRALAGEARARSSSLVLLAGGILCLAGTAGPLTGRMMLQNIAVLGYAVLLPVAAALVLRLFRGTAPKEFR